MERFSAIYRLIKTPSESKLLTALSVVVGAAAGVSAYLFIKLITFVQYWLAWLGHWHISALDRTLLVLAPAMGGLVAGWLVQRFSPDHRGTGTAQVILALRRRHGVIPEMVTISKTLASAMVIGTGGSAGPEGPVVQIGSGLGSAFGRWFRLPAEHLKTLVAAGAASAIAAVFNAPIAGVMYAIEVLLRQIVSQIFAVVVLSTVTASVVSYLLVGHHLFVESPPFPESRLVEWGAYVLLGVFAAIAARIFTIIFLSTEKTFGRLSRISLPYRAMLGGLGVGMIGFFRPEIMGPGHELVSAMIRGGPLALTRWLLAAILIEKMFATSLSLASGGSGGLFVPTLSMGALLGTIFGKLVHLFVPQAAPPWAYALLGMGGMFAGFTYAPFTSVILLFEMTNEYAIILPAMLVVGITTIVSRVLDTESLDGHELSRQGLRLHDEVELRPLEHFTVREVMSSPVETIRETATLSEISLWMAKSRHSGVPVADAQGKVVGLITYEELHLAFEEQSGHPEPTAKQIMRASFPTLHPTDSLTEAVRRMQNENTDRLIVFSPEAPGMPAGIITKSDILKIYRKALS